MDIDRELDAHGLRQARERVDRGVLNGLEARQLALRQLSASANLGEDPAPPGLVE